MSGRIYDSGINPICKKCASPMRTSQERNFYGPKCKNIKCDGGISEAVYTPFEDAKPAEIKYHYTDEGKLVLTGVFVKF